MGSVVVDLSGSLDGFIAGSDDGLDLPLGRGGERSGAHLRYRVPRG